MKLGKDRLHELVAFVEPGSDDITYTHAVFAQCFLPLRRIPNGGKRYEVRHGRAALLITAGDLLNPATQEFVQMDVPSGSAARIALAHINNHIIRSKTREEALTVPMGESLRDFMDYQGLAIGGKNGKEIARQIHNLAAARIVLGVWTDDRARQINAQIADAIDFWLERDRRQPLATFTPRLATLTFQEQLGSMLDKVRRLEQLTPWVAAHLGLSAEETATAVRAASLCKSDLATSMVVRSPTARGNRRIGRVLPNGVQHRSRSTQPSRSGRWAPLTSPHRPAPSVPSHRSGSSRSRNSRNWRTCQRALIRSTYWTRSRPTSRAARTR